MTTLAEALRRAQDFIQATEIYPRDDFVRPDNRKGGREDKGHAVDKRTKKDDERIERFHTTLHNILMEIKGSPMRRRLKPINTPPKFKNKIKYCEYHEDQGHTTAARREFKKPSVCWPIGGSSTPS